MTPDTLSRLDSRKYPKLVGFIYDLLRDSRLNRQVPLDRINVNDWENNTNPSVYVSAKHNPWKVKKYSRSSPHDLEYAIKFYNSDGKKSNTWLR